MVEWYEVGVVFSIPLLLVLFIVALFVSGSTVRRRIGVVGKDDRIRSEWVHERRIVRENGHPWYVFRKAKYDWTGPWYEFEYRMVRSFGLRRYIGAQRIYIEGNPTPYRFKEDERLASLAGTAVSLFNEAESDLPNRAIRPRRVDLTLIVIISLMTLAVGFALGGRFG